jgi:hypothetical protein
MFTYIQAKTKAEKNRQRVEEAFMKTTHAARAEAAAVRREEKKRQEKERILLVSLQLGCHAKLTLRSFIFCFAALILL